MNGLLFVKEKRKLKKKTRKYMRYIYRITNSFNDVTEFLHVLSVDVEVIVSK